MRILPTRISGHPAAPHRELNNLLPVFNYKPSAKTTPARLAATNKCLARTNKSRTRVGCYKEARRQRGAILLAPPGWRDPLRGQRCRSFTALWRRESRAKAEHELAPSRAVFFPPACRLRGVTGYYLRGHPEVFKKPLPTHVPPAGSGRSNSAQVHALAAGGDEQTFGENRQVRTRAAATKSGDGSAFGVLAALLIGPLGCYLLQRSGFE